MTRLARITLAALAIVPLVLVAAVVLAVYGIDPIGIARTAPSASANLAIHQANAFKMDSVELYLIPMQRVEYKFRLERALRWCTPGSRTCPVYFDMHNVPEGKPLTASERIEEGEATEAHGVYTAPYAGIHGWFWENRRNDGVLIDLKAAGFFTEALMISDGEVTPMPLQDPPPPKEPFTHRRAPSRRHSPKPRCRAGRRGHRARDRGATG